MTEGAKPLGKSERFLAKQVDSLIVTSLTLPLWALFLTGLVGRQEVIETLLIDRGHDAGLMLLSLAVARMTVWFAYDWIFLAAFGRTPGKFAIGLRVAPARGGRPSAGAAAVRTILLLPLGLGMGLPGVSLLTLIAGRVQLEKHPQTIWDRWSRTQVVGYPAPLWRKGIGALAIVAFPIPYLAVMIWSGVWDGIMSV